MSRRILTTFSIIMITITSVDSIRNLPATALFGPQLIFFFIIGALLFLLPAALVSAELASAFSEGGGVYVWVKKAFGTQWGFLAIWFQWTENIVWYPTILSFVAGTLAYIISPTLADNKYYLTAVIWIVFWAVTWLNWRGLRLSANFSVICGMLGLLIPMAVIILFGLSWIIHGGHLQISFHAHELLPNFSDPTIMVSLTGVMLSYCGIEIATVYASDVRNPQRDYGRGLMIATVIIAGTLILASLSIAIIVPQHQLNLVSGIMQAFTAFFQADHVSWLIPIMAVCIILGALGGISNWTMAPIKGLLVAAEDNLLPRLFQRENRHGTPSALLLIQGVVVSIISLVFIFMPSINSSYWLITVITAQIYMLMYILMFLAGIRLRYNYPDQPRPFRVRGGNLGMWFVGGIGIISSIFTFVIGFAPPQGIVIHNVAVYDFLIGGGVLIMTIPALIIYRYRHKF